MAKYLALDKVKRFWDIIRHNGGLINSYLTLYRTDELKIGTLVGMDKFGNKYYENKMYFYGTWNVRTLHRDYSLDVLTQEFQRYNLDILGLQETRWTGKGRNRWVDYSLGVNMDYNASQVPPEWHRWLHYMTDDPPTKVPPVQHKWIVDHTENFSGTKDAYVPYSTTVPKIKPWVPPKKNVAEK